MLGHRAVGALQGSDLPDGAVIGRGGAEALVCAGQAVRQLRGGRVQDVAQLNRAQAQALGDQFFRGGFIAAGAHGLPGAQVTVIRDLIVQDGDLRAAVRGIIEGLIHLVDRGAPDLRSGAPSVRGAGGRGRFRVLCRLHMGGARVQVIDAVGRAQGQQPRLAEGGAGAEVQIGRRAVGRQDRIAILIGNDRLAVRADDDICAVRQLQHGIPGGIRDDLALRIQHGRRAGRRDDRLAVGIQDGLAVGIQHRHQGGSAVRILGELIGIEGSAGELGCAAGRDAGNRAGVLAGLGIDRAAEDRRARDAGDLIGRGGAVDDPADIHVRRRNGPGEGEGSALAGREGRRGADREESAQAVRNRDIGQRNLAVVRHGDQIGDGFTLLIPAAVGREARFRLDDGRADNGSRDHRAQGIGMPIRLLVRIGIRGLLAVRIGHRIFDGAVLVGRGMGRVAVPGMTDPPHVLAGGAGLIHDGTENRIISGHDMIRHGAGLGFSGGELREGADGDALIRDDDIADGLLAVIGYGQAPPDRFTLLEPAAVGGDIGHALVQQEAGFADHRQGQAVGNSLLFLSAARIGPGALQGREIDIAVVDIRFGDGVQVPIGEYPGNT